MSRHSKGRLFSSHSRGALNARLRRIIIFSCIAFVSIIILLIAGYSQLMSYLQGNNFRQRVANYMKVATGASSVNIASDFTINGNRISTEGIEVSGVQTITKAEASRISLELNRAALLSRCLHVRKLSVEEAALSLNSLTPPSENTPKKHSSRKNKTLASESKFSLKGIELDFIECRDADLNLQHKGGEYQLLGANISASPAPRLGKGAWQINAENARLHTPFGFLRDSSIKSTTAIYQNNVIDITECRLMLTPGEIRMKAHYDLKRADWTADMQVNKGNIHRILNEDWKKRASGELYGKILLTADKGSISTASGAFSIQNGRLEGLPFLSQIPVGNTYPYRSIELEKADCQVVFPYNGDKLQNAWLLDKISMCSRDGAFQLKGHILIGSDRRLGGTLSIGLPKSIATAFPLSQEELTSKLFSTVGDDDTFLWVNMNLSGTLDHPKEDLSIRIATLASQSLSKFIKHIPKGKATDLLNTLLEQKMTAPGTNAAPDTQPTPPPAGNLIDDAANAAGSLLNSLF